MPDLHNLKMLLSKRGEQEKLSKAIGVSSGNISDWFNPNKKATPNAAALCKISDYYNCSIDYILGRTENPKMVADNIKIYRFPVYEQRAAAGVGQLGRDGNYNMENYVVNNIPDNATFAMRIDGESMNSEQTNNLIHTDSIVLINSKYDDSELDNSIVIASFQGKVICKRYINKSSYILFKSDNPEWESENKSSIDDPNCKVLGIVLGVIEDDMFIYTD